MEEQDKSADDIVARIETSIAELNSLRSDEKEAADAMQLRKRLEKSIINVQRANRDIHSLKWRRLNSTELESETQAILGRIKNVEETTPQSIEVSEKNEFVSYPNKDDVAKALGIVINSTNQRLSGKETEELAQENYRLQSLVTVTTKSKIIDVVYLSGKKDTITVIEKLVGTEKADFSNMTQKLAFFEVIPKEISSNLSGIELLFDHEVILEDPVLGIDISNIIQNI